ncbi:MAG TPA: 4-hydroxythreonine-4-phosphate dehydrogenase PdxA [Thermoguttaceae bacterium]|nr:4-hydroxythreonine-4-phosphate dehydrogenase PdxA [Thermoguttaceae bacterium]
MPHSSHVSLPRLAVTMGDPAGVGPELCLRLLKEPRVLAACVPIVFGDTSVLHRVGEICRLPMPQNIVPMDDFPKAFSSIDCPTLIDHGAIDGATVEPGQVRAACGRAGLAYVDAAIRAALDRQVAGVVTAPIHKEALHLAGIPFAGHTEILADRTRAARCCMMLTSERITVSLVTTHVGLREVADALSTERILEVIELTAAAMRRIRRRAPRLIVCALNPHAGEGGLFGRREEERFIVPAVAAAREKGIDVQGPLPPDTAFLPARLDRADAHVCMYHDQGLIPLKLLAFDTAVNVTLGLPIVRTSVDHGTAMDIAWTGKARAESLVHATLLAARLATSTEEAATS